LLASRNKPPRVSDALRKCRERFEAELKNLSDAEEVKTAGYICQAFPAPVAAGLGLRPVRVHCGASAGSESEGESIVRADACPMIKSLLGNVSTGSGLHAHVDLWVGLLSCDQMRRGLFALSDEFGREVHPIQLPATRTEESARYYASQVKRFVKDVEALHGLGFDVEKANKWQTASDGAADVLIKAVRSMEHSPLLIHAMFHLYFIANPFGLAEFFGELIDSAPRFEARGRVVVTGSPIEYEDALLYEALDEAGIAALPLNCTGLNALEPDETVEVPGSDEAVERMALEAFYRAPCARARPNAAVYTRLKSNVSATMAEGVILKCLKFCDLWHTENRRMAEALDVPVLVLDSVYAEGESGRLRSRIEAFIETIA